MNTAPQETQENGTTRIKDNISTAPETYMAMAGVEQMMLTLSTNAMVANTSIKQAIHEHFSAGGKRIRARMALETGARLGLDVRTSQAVAACCELLHNASLIHDDIQDIDEARRGRPSLWARHGSNLAICAGDELISAAYAALAEVADARAIPALIRMTHRAVSRTVAGQTADLAQRSMPLDDITLYETIAGEKSGPLLGLPVSLCLSLVELPDTIETVEQAVRLIAIGYQLVDDIGDWVEDQAQGNLNGVLVLARAAQSAPAAAVGDAAALTRRHLHHARKQAALLPQGAGQVFVDLADRLDAKLVLETAGAA